MPMPMPMSMCGVQVARQRALNRALELQRESIVPMLLDDNEEVVRHVDLCQLHTIKDPYLFLAEPSLQRRLEKRKDAVDKMEVRGGRRSCASLSPT